MLLSEVMRSTAGVRLYERDDVPDDVIYEVLDQARFAPSGGNRQPWRVIIVRDQDTKARVREISVREWYRYTERWYGDIQALDDARLKKYQEGTDYHQTLDSAPLHLLVWVELAALAVTDSDLDRQSFDGGGSIFPFIQNIQLSFWDRDFGTRITTLAVSAEAEIAELVGAPNGFGLAAVMTVGKPSWVPTKLSRRPVTEFAWLEQFGGLPLTRTTD